MSRLIVLDSGPLGMVTNPKAKGVPLACQLWLKSLLRRGERVAIPEIADYEVRRELLRAGLLRSLHRLDNLKQTLEYIPIRLSSSYGDKQDLLKGGKGERVRGKGVLMTHSIAV